MPDASVSISLCCDTFLPHPAPTLNIRGLTEGGGVGSSSQREGRLIAKQPGAKGRGTGGGGAEPSRLISKQTLLFEFNKR